MFNKWTLIFRISLSLHSPTLSLLSLSHCALHVAFARSFFFIKRRHSCWKLFYGVWESIRPHDTFCTRTASPKRQRARPLMNCLSQSNAIKIITPARSLIRARAACRWHSHTHTRIVPCPAPLRANVGVRAQCTTRQGAQCQDKSTRAQAASNEGIFISYSSNLQRSILSELPLMSSLPAVIDYCFQTLVKTYLWNKWILGRTSFLEYD